MTIIILSRTLNTFFEFECEPRLKSIKTRRINWYMFKIEKSHEVKYQCAVIVSSCKILHRTMAVAITWIPQAISSTQYSSKHLANTGPNWGPINLAIWADLHSLPRSRLYVSNITFRIDTWWKPKPVTNWFGRKSFNLRNIFISS